MRTAGDGTATAPTAKDAKGRRGPAELEPRLLQVESYRAAGDTYRLPDGAIGTCPHALPEHVPIRRPYASSIRRCQSYSLAVTACSMRWMRPSRRSKVRLSLWSAIRRELV